MWGKQLFENLQYRDFKIKKSEPHNSKLSQKSQKHLAETEPMSM